MANEKQRFPTAGESQRQSEVYHSIDMGDNSGLMIMEKRQPSPEPTAKNLWKGALRAVKAKLNNKSYGRPEPNNDDHISILVSDRGICELTGMAASVLANGLVVPENNLNPGPQGGNDNGVGHHIEVPGDGPAYMLPTFSPANLAIPLWIMSLLTLIMVIATALYKPARGVVFGRNKGAYYLALSVIFASGVAEALTAYWVSRSRYVNRRRFSFGRVVLCASTGPFVAIVAIGGFAFSEG